MLNPFNIVACSMINKLQCFPVEHLVWYGPLTGWGIILNNIQDHYDIDTVEECQLLCLQEPTCVSIEYGSRGLRDCYLSDVNRAADGIDFVAEFPSQDYYELIEVVGPSSYGKKAC